MLKGKPKLDVPCRLKFTWRVKNKRVDLDNCAFAKKYVLDGFVKAGLIPDDSMKYITEFTDTFVVDKNVGVDITSY